MTRQEIMRTLIRAILSLRKHGIYLRTGDSVPSTCVTYPDIPWGESGCNTCITWYTAHGPPDVVIIWSAGR